jgi:hypothetical protein
MIPGQDSLLRGPFTHASVLTDATGGENMAKRTYKCFTCGKVYDSEARAVKCHDAPVQKLVENEARKKPRFLGN